jgi:glyoxylase-like metal-dependent hydrolase (beta-lactamase superfamily II)
MLAKDVWQLTSLFRNWFNVYLLEDVLIDAATRWSERRIFRQLQGHPVRLLALTHCHPDHQGSANAACARLGVSLACHKADVAALEGRSHMVPHNFALRLTERLWAGPRQQVGRLLHDGDMLGSFRVYHAPGHTPGHVMFFRESDRVAVVGDVLANMSYLTGREMLREPPAMFTADIEENRRSIRLLADLKPNLVCFGHGPPLRNPQLLEVLAARHVRVTGKLAAQLQHG